jgi:hypothetical protein
VSKRGFWGELEEETRGGRVSKRGSRGGLEEGTREGRVTYHVSTADRPQQAAASSFPVVPAR